MCLATSEKKVSMKCSGCKPIRLCLFKGKLKASPRHNAHNLRFGTEEGIFVLIRPYTNLLEWAWLSFHFLTATVGCAAVLY